MMGTLLLHEGNNLEYVVLNRLVDYHQVSNVDKSDGFQSSKTPGVADKRRSGSVLGRSQLTPP